MRQAWSPKSTQEETQSSFRVSCESPTKVSLNAAQATLAMRIAYSQDK
jgi:hypothetical protein